MTTLDIHRLAGKQLRQVTATLGPGLHVLLTLDSVGVEELAPLLDGSTMPRRGSVRLDGRQPHRDPELRRAIGSLWNHETLPDAAHARLSLERLGLDEVQRRDVADCLDELRLLPLLDQPTSKLDQRGLRSIALAVALTKREAKALVLAEPFASTAADQSGLLLERLSRAAATLPVVVITASRMTASRLSGPTAELAAGFWRSVPSPPANVFTLRLSGANLRPLAAEIVRRPLVQSLRLTNRVEGYDELWLATADPCGLSLDVVRATRQLGVALWSVETLSGVA